MAASTFGVRIVTKNVKLNPKNIELSPTCSRCPSSWRCQQRSMSFADVKARWPGKKVLVPTAMIDMQTFPKEFKCQMFKHLQFVCYDMTVPSSGALSVCFEVTDNLCLHLGTCFMHTKKEASRKHAREIRKFLLDKILVYYGGKSLHFLEILKIKHVRAKRYWQYGWALYEVTFVTPSPMRVIIPC